MRVAIVHDWVTGLRGGERVLDQVADLFPDADLYTLFYEAGTTTERIDRLRVQTSFLDRVPGLRRRYHWALPLFPWAARRFMLRDYDLVLSIHHAVAKAIRLTPGTPHLCYCLTPMRYIWDQSDAYLGRGARRVVAAPLVSALRRFDRRSSDAVTRFVAISRSVADRIERHYGRRASLLYPPVDVERFQIDPNAEGKAYLLITSFAPYKRAEVAIGAAARLGRPLVVVGDGPARRHLEKNAPKHIRFLGRVPEDQLVGLVQQSRALLQPQEEDFGIAALEAQAAGRPVIAFDRGGATETVRPWREDRRAGATGVWFSKQHAEALAEAMLRFESLERFFDPRAIRDHALQFSSDRFRSGLRYEIEALLGASADGVSAS